jgi:predicted dehydrogenase
VKPVYDYCMSTFGVGVLSFAHGHAATYCDAMQHFDDARVIAAWDDNAVRGEETVARFGLALEPTPEALLARPDIDAVIVTCETNRHVELIELACSAGKSILCQKPLATTLEDCDRIIEAVDNSGVHFQMAFQMRCDPLNQQIKRWIVQGKIGRVGAIRRRHCINVLFNQGFINSAGAWHFDAQKNVGMFFDDAVHATDFFYWLLGKPQSVIAEIENTLTTVAPDDCGMAIYKWQTESGVVLGSLLNSSVALAGENTCEVYGDKGVIIQNYDDAVSTRDLSPDAVGLKLYSSETGAWEYFDYQLPQSHGERLKAVPRDWIDNLKNNRPPTVSARDGEISVEMCAAAYRSAKEGKRINL